MLTIFIRTILVYLLVLLVIRLMGKAELSNMSPFQMVVVFMIAELAAIPIESSDASLEIGLISIATLTFLQMSISFISLKSEKFKHFINGKPSILIDEGKINYKELKKLRITINDLMEQLRLGNSPSISEVEYAIMESNGDLSIIQRADSKPLTPKDITKHKDREMMPIVLISDGNMYHENIIRCGWNEEQLTDEIKRHDISDISKVFLVFCDSSAKLHIYMKENDSKFASEVIVP